jgi:ankyrin repeat protein
MGKTPLLIAIECGAEIDVINLLIKYGADSFLIDNVIK